MSETIDDLRILAKQVRNASSQGENTAERVGHVMEGTLDLIEGASPDLSKYYTKQESDTLLLSKWTYDAARAASWDEASKDRHTHTNKPALDLIVFDPVKNVWKFTGNAAFSGDVISYANLGDVDVPTIYEGLPIDNKTIKRDINGVLFAESTTGGSFDESSMWTALGTSISSKLIAQRYLNLAGYATEAYVTEKIQGLGAVFNLKGTKAAPSDLPTTGNKVGDVWYVASESVGYIWITDEKGVLRWEKFGEPVDLSAYYTKTETNALLSSKWTTDTVLISHWDDAYTLRHSHSNKAIIDGITNALINNWNSAAADSHKHANKPALDLIEYDSVKKLWKFTGNAAFSGDVITYANLGDVNIPEIYDGLPIDNVTIKRYANGQLYAAETTGSKFDKDAMWLALSTATAEQINKSHLIDALSTYVLTTDSRLSDSRNAADVYAWAKQPNPPTVDLSNYVTTNTEQTIRATKSFDGVNYFTKNNVFINGGNEYGLYSGLEVRNSSDSNRASITFHQVGVIAKVLSMNKYGALEYTDGGGIFGSLKINDISEIVNIASPSSLIYTSKNNQLFYSNSNNSIPILSLTDNVGIGTLNPIHKLHVVGSIYSNGVSGSNSGFYITQTGLDYCGLQPNFRISSEGDARDIWLYNLTRIGYNANEHYFQGGNVVVANKFVVNNVTYDSFRTKGGIVAEGNTLQLGNVKLTYDFANRAIRFTMVDGSPCNIVSSGDMISYALAGTGIINEGYAFKDSLFVDYGKSTVVDNPKSLISLAIGDINTGFDRTALNRIDIISNGSSIGYWNASSFHSSKNFYADANSFFAGRAYFGDKLGIGTVSPSQALSVVGNIIASGTITPSTSSSDIRLKTDVRDFIAEDIIRSLNPKSYKWNEKAKQRGTPFRTNKDQFGLMYQDVKENPFVSEFAIDNAFGDGYGSVGYDRFAAILIKGEIELFNKVETIETKVDRLEKENEILKTRLKEMGESHGSI